MSNEYPLTKIQRFVVLIVGLCAILICVTDILFCCTYDPPASIRVHSYCKLETTGSNVRIPYCVYIQIPESGEFYSFKRIKESKLSNNLLTIVYEIETNKPPIDKLKEVGDVRIVQ
jgi:hypothetical protein